MERDREVVRRLERWFRDNARDLPWRRERGGYTALVAEAMLQQTQVVRVLERFEAFLQRFPTIQALAQAHEQEVLAAWQGLGYYRRARHLHAAAQIVVRDFGGVVPRTAEELRRLPGVGRYTAGAVASTVYGQREPIVDGNVHRVLMRLDARREDGQLRTRANAHAWTWDRAAGLVQRAVGPGVFNEAMMELGAMVCTPVSPRCDMCPVRGLCRARAKGVEDEIPAPKASLARREVHHHAVVVRRGAKVLLEQRPREGLWSEMWQTPTVESEGVLEDREVQLGIGVSMTRLSKVESFAYLTTHRRVVFHVFTARSRARRGMWCAVDEIELPMSNAHRRVLEVGWGSGS